MRSSWLVAAVLAVLLGTAAKQVDAGVQPSPAEGRAIAECLQPYGGVTPENAERLQRYKQWSDTYEEIPCFTHCYLGKMFDIYNASGGFREESVVRQFGRPLFDACKHRLAEGRDACELAYNGFHCLVSLENDPFVYIESLEKVDSESKTAMKECLRRFDQYEWARLPEFATFPVREPIPCFTKCFLDRLQLFSERTRQWKHEALAAKLGIRPEAALAPACRALGRRRGRNTCAWMYQEFTCFSMVKP